MSINNSLFSMGVVSRTEERYRTEWVSGTGKDATTRQVSEGWFVILDSGMSMHMGAQEPECAPGDTVMLAFKKGR